MRGSTPREDGDDEQDRGVDRVRPHEVARAAPSATAITNRIVASDLALGGRAVQRRLDRRDDLLLVGLLTGGSRGRRAGRAITVEK